MPTIIKSFETKDMRFPLSGGAGSDAVNQNPQYAYAVCILSTESKEAHGVGLAFTLGKGTELVCQAIEYLGQQLIGKEIEELMADFAQTYHSMANMPNLRWLGPHKGVVHLALAAVTNACFDLWAKSRQQPLWALLLDLPPKALVNLIDFSYLEDLLYPEEAQRMIEENIVSRQERSGVIAEGYAGYDTSVGWFHYSESQLVEKVKKSLGTGFKALKLKVGSSDLQRDVKRAMLLRELCGDDFPIMVDANQQWNLVLALEACKELKKMNPYWIEEPTHPDDLYAHIHLEKEIRPMKLALGEHVPNAFVFKGYFQSGIMRFNQVDAVRVGGISEFLAISLLSKKFDVPVVPHVGDMGQIHQHLVLFNHIGLNHEKLFLEHIPHLQSYFKNPAQLMDGKYQTPEEPGLSSDLIGLPS